MKKVICGKMNAISVYDLKNDHCIIAKKNDKIAGIIIADGNGYKLAIACNRKLEYKGSIVDCVKKGEDEGYEFYVA